MDFEPTRGRLFDGFVIAQDQQALSASSFVSVDPFAVCSYVVESVTLVFVKMHQELQGK